MIIRGWDDAYVTFKCIIFYKYITATKEKGGTERKRGHGVAWDGKIHITFERAKRSNFWIAKSFLNESDVLGHCNSLESKLNWLLI